ncbi:DPP IV N-terminal domain-containing protein [Kribbella sp. CA-294648]|uniref:S9 family peptidase n=1 Tax=Kribbella sp. CA-294648 TaxID=3239948 RepID=UPI003D8E8588
MTDQLAASVYQTAEQFLRHNRPQLVQNAVVTPQWIDGGARLRYETERAGNPESVLVDPLAGTREITTEPAETVGSGDFLAVVSPDRKHEVFRRGHDLWLRSLADGSERPLTTDGAEDHEYGTAPFSPDVLLKKLGIPHLPASVAWSPDSTKVLTHQLDQRAVRTVHMIDVTTDEPSLYSQRLPYPGDEQLPMAEYVVLDVNAGTTVRSEPFAMGDLSPLLIKWAWWSEAGDAVYFLQQPRGLHALSLRRLNPVTGEVTTLLTETGETRVEPAQGFGQAPMVKIIDDGILWYSQRDGWGHLYLYDAAGELRNQVTQGEWAVQQILRVDEATRSVYFVATGLVASNPYRRTVCRIGLDGTGFARITDDELDHVVTVPENEQYFVDSASTTAQPPTITVRGWDGQVLVDLETADPSKLLATGWNPPEEFRVKSADGTTDVYGLLYKPHGFDPTKRYPIVDHPYPGPHQGRLVPTYDPGLYGVEVESMAALGFVAVVIEGRGNPGRSKAFHDATYRRYDRAGSLEDHVAGIRELAATRPWMDLDRVGIFGQSGGGFATVRALADFPDFYRVGVAEAGNHDNRVFSQAWVEAYDGPAGERDYAESDNGAVVDRIEGKLLLVHGGLDTSVNPHHTLRLVDRLIAADKDFDLVVVPGAEHIFFGYEHHVNRRKWDFLVRNLLAAEPPAGYRLTPAPVDLALVAALFG